MLSSFLGVFGTGLTFTSFVCSSFLGVTISSSVIFPSYRFLMTYDKENDVTWGEDLNFFKFLASKQVSVKCESITVGHLKGVQIW